MVTEPTLITCSRILRYAQALELSGDRLASYIVTQKAFNGYVQIFGAEGVRAPEIDALLYRRRPFA